MRCLQFTKFYPPVLGGIETATHELAEGLMARGIATDVLCAHTERHTVHEKVGAVQVARAGSYARLLSTSMAPSLVTELYKVRSEHDVIHVHLPNPMANVALMMARPQGRIVLHWHSDIINQTRALKLYEPLQKWMLDRADAIIATSQPYADASPWLKQYLHKVHVVPLGIPLNHRQHPADALEASRAGIRAQHGQRPIVFSIGRMATYKGFDQLIQAARGLHRDARVVVGGGGELLEAHRAAVNAAELQDRIVFTGRLSELDVAAYMAEAEIFCLPSTNRAEAFGMVLLEAMAAGLPIVSSYIEGSGVPWVNQHGETGLHTRVSDPVALSAALNQLLDDPAMARQLGRGGRNRLANHFTSDRMIEQTIEVYRRVCGTTH